MRKNAFNLVMILLLSTIPAAYSVGRNGSDTIDAYVERVKQKLRCEWHPSGQRLLSITKFTITLDKTGAIAKREFVTGGSEKERRTVDDCLQRASFGALPMGRDSLDLRLSFILDSSMRLIDVAQDVSPSDKTVSVVRDKPAKEYIADFRPYLANLQAHIKRFWHPPADSKSLESSSSVVQFTIGQNGELSNLKMHKTSGSDELDQAALKAVKDAAPFSPIPPWATSPVEIQFTFDDRLFLARIR
jgi:TonB family protein